MIIGATKLLVSVRDADEARLALGGGADLIDVKEPSRGPLGAADAATIERVSTAVAGRVPTSAALGELRDHGPLATLPCGCVDYAKFGLSGCAGDWTSPLRAALAALPEGVVGVAVCYADWKAACAPDPVPICFRSPTLYLPSVGSLPM